METEDDITWFHCSHHRYIQAFSAGPRVTSHLNNNVLNPNRAPKNSHIERGRGASDNVKTRGKIIRSDTKMVPVQISETVAVVQVPNYEERYVGSIVDLHTMKRHNERVNFEPVLAPVHFADTLICYKNSTRKRYVSRTFYEPRVKPRRFAETTIIYPKKPEKSFVSCLDYHIDECRRWFKTCMEFKAKTYTTKKMDVGNNANDFDNKIQDPGASQVFLPRFNTDGVSYERKFKFAHPDINMNQTPINGF